MAGVAGYGECSVRVIVAGPRDLYVENVEVARALKLADEEWPERIVHGGARGIDSCAHRFAITFGISEYIYEADWETHGKAAGPLRNREMANNADALVVIKRRGGATRGTSSMIKEAQKAGLPVYVMEVAE